MNTSTAFAQRKPTQEAISASNVIDISAFRTPCRPAATGRPSIYVEINDLDQVKYGMVDVCAADAVRLHRAALNLAERLAEVSRG
jgi:hypothetical protein